VDVVDGIKNELTVLKSVLPSDVQVAVSYDASSNVREALSDVNLSLILGALLAVLVVFSSCTISEGRSLSR